MFDSQPSAQKSGVYREQPATPTEVRTWLDTHRARTDALLARTIPSPTTGESATLLEAMRYATTGGKRMRALLVYAAAAISPTSTAEAISFPSEEAFLKLQKSIKTRPDVADAPAVAVELIHAYSLVHDDLPCMDDDALRRGQPSCHVRYGEAMALLAGDALQALAFQLLATSTLPDPAQAVAVLAEAAGPLGMVGGQALDMAATGATQDQEALIAIEHIHRRKTGALIRAAIVLGGLCTGAQRELIRILTLFGDAIGLAYQIADDLLDAEATSDQLGKTAGKDQAQNKVTYVTLLGVDEARRRLVATYDEALEHLAPLGNNGRWLRTLAQQLVEREF